MGAAPGTIVDMKELGVWEPYEVKAQTIKTAVESATLLLRIDDIVSGLAKRDKLAPGQSKMAPQPEDPDAVRPWLFRCAGPSNDCVRVFLSQIFLWVAGGAAMRSFWRRACSLAGKGLPACCALHCRRSTHCCSCAPVRRWTRSR